MINNTIMDNNEITTTEWEFLTTTQGDSIKLYTVPFITAKLQYSLNKYFAPAFEKQLMLNMTDADFQNMLKSSGINANVGGINLADYKAVFLNEMKNKPLVELTKYDFDKAVEFILLCIDKQRILAENNRADLDLVLKKENWEIQKPELMEAIINQYSFRFNADNTISDRSVGEPEVLPIRKEPKYNLRTRDGQTGKEEPVAEQKG